jgi:hypothetical protein
MHSCAAQVAANKAGGAMTEESTSSKAIPDVWMLEDLHKMRSYAEMKGMWDTHEALRLAIIHTALHLGTATGLSALELSYGLTPMPRSVRPS